MQQRLVRRHSKKSRVRFWDLRLSYSCQDWLMIIGALIRVADWRFIVNLIVPMPIGPDTSVSALILYGLVVGRILGGVRDWGDEDWK